MFVCQYLEKCGLSYEVIVCFVIGFVFFGWDNVLKWFGGNLENCQLLIDVGMLVINDQGCSYDCFCEWVMFFICDKCGWVIGFGGCVLGNDIFKYLNLLEIDIFYKGCQFYSFYEVQQDNVEFNCLFVVEGYMDVVVLV